MQMLTAIHRRLNIWRAGVYKGLRLAFAALLGHHNRNIQFDGNCGRTCIMG